ncbi:MAG: LD-carboxypeptidase [Cyanobacteriota bacterium]|nr:LD-carboxypeptidase [Cyanobacteriota bacterium]
MSRAYRVPPALTPGDSVMVVAASGAAREPQALAQGVEIWRKRGYQVRFSDHWQAQNGYLAGSDAQRRDSLRQAWQDPQIKAILCARGGYGAARLLENWTWPPLTAPKWLIGFSDVTSLLWSLAGQGITALHGPVLTTLGTEPEWSLERLFDYLEGGALAELQGQGWGGAPVRGPLIAGNLTVATHLLATPLLPDLRGSILALEDVTEAPYRIDRMLTQWRLSGVLNQLGGLALGRFSRCEAPGGYPSWSVGEVLRERLGDLGLPIVADLPFGHDGPNPCLPLGAEAELDPGAGTLRILAA